MIRLHSFVSETDYIQLNWTRPDFLPEMYQLKYTVTMKTIYASIHKLNGSVMIKTLNLSSENTSVRISGLRPSSICTINLLAVFNPASIDSGIEITGRTLDEDTSEKNHCLYDFMTPYFGHCFLIVKIFSCCRPNAKIKRINIG